MRWVGSLENGKLALDFILGNSVDVILCDVKMPVMTGIELAKEIHGRGLKMKIVMLGVMSTSLTSIYINNAIISSLPQ